MRYKNEKDLYNALQKHLIPDLLSYKKATAHTIALARTSICR